MATPKIVLKIHLSRGILRELILQLHLILGLIAGLFLAILGLTGAVMAFEGDIDHWLHPERWYVKPGRRPLPENELVSVAQNRFKPARVFAVQFQRAANLAQVIRMTDGTLVYLNPYDGSVLGETVGTSTSDQALITIHQIHVRLIPDLESTPELAVAGRFIVAMASLFLCLLIPTGLALWWRDKRAFFRSRATNFKIPWFTYFKDAHLAFGLYASLFLWIAAFTGILIGFDFGQNFFYMVTGTKQPAPLAPFQSTPVPEGKPLMADQVLDIAQRAFPGASPSLMLMPLQPTAVFTVLMRVPEETSQNVHSSVMIDQFSGRVLDVRSYLTDSSGYRLLRLNRSIHNGDIFGLPSRILVSLSGLMLFALVVTGVVTWWKKLSAPPQ